jgi:hypothetical protein
LTPPKTIAPSRPLPTAKAETQSGAGWRYQRLNGSAGGGASPVNVTAEEFAGRHKANAVIKTAKMKCLTVFTIDLELMSKPYRRPTAKTSGDAPGRRMPGLLPKNKSEIISEKGRLSEIFPKYFQLSEIFGPSLTRHFWKAERWGGQKNGLSDVSAPPYFCHPRLARHSVLIGRVALWRRDSFAAGH